MWAVESVHKASQVQLLLELSEGVFCTIVDFLGLLPHNWVCFVCAEPYFDVPALELF